MLKLYYLRHGSLLVIFTTLLTLVSAQPTLKWVARYAGPDQMQDVPHSMTVDLKGNVYVTGQSVGEGTESDFITLKYDKDGHELWSKRYNNNSNLSDGPTGIATDLSGNVYVTGWSDLNGQSRVFTTIKYDPLGNVIWLREYAGIGNSWNIATAIAIDDLGYIYVIGASKGQEGNYDYVTIKYDFAGNEQWIRRFNSGENSDDYPNSLVIGKSGSVYITG